MAGNQSRALILISKAKGWDPTEIKGTGNKPTASVLPFDKDQGTAPGYGDHCVGELPGGPQPYWKDGWEQDLGAGDPNRLPFSTPDTSRERQDNKGGGQDPFPGMGAM